jgi:hypothetical protein
MNGKIKYILFITLALFIRGSAQTVIPVNIRKSVEKNFRTVQGTPGPGYFQNRSSYVINARFDPVKGRLTGSAKITYFNNSPDTLEKILLRLYQNIASRGGIRDEQWEAGDIHRGVSITALKVNQVDWMEDLSSRTRNEGTNFTIFLRDPLLPHDSVQIGIGWNFLMPGSEVHRYGKYGDGSYFVSMWYPQVAVYDDIDGWDEMQYTGTHEFYNDFNDFDVKIKVPGRFMVWATGEWMNARKILHPEIYKRWEKAAISDGITHIFGEEKLNNNSYLSNKGSNTFHFTARNIPDFAFGISDTYVWDACSILADSSQSRRIVVHAAYDKESRYFDSVAAYGCELIKHFCLHSYRVAFPYDHITVFNGGGGMEYPMIVNNGSTFSRDATLFLTMHEIAHSYFPFLTGINERKYSWMDEGLTTYLPIETEKAMRSDYYPLSGIVRNYQYLAGTESDIPLFVPAYQTREKSYQYYSYIRSSVAFHMLELYMGREDFRKGIREFIQIWQNKHPTPYDFFAVLKNSSTKDLYWFIDQWFFQQGYPDLAIEDVKQEHDLITVEIRNEGTFAVPVVLYFYSDEGLDFELRESAEVWKGADRYVISHRDEKKIVEVRLGDHEIPDITPENNIFKIE